MWILFFYLYTNNSRKMIKAFNSSRFIFIILLQLLIPGPTFPQLYSTQCMTRGADTAEFYLLCPWYFSANSTNWAGIFRSTDNGQTLSIQRKMNWNFEYGLIFGDSSQGVLFEIPCRHQDTLGISYDCLTVSISSH